MMYGSMAFSKDGVHYTMLPKDYGVQISDPGAKGGMTELDVTALKKLYSCDSKPTGNDLDDENKDPNEGNNFGDKFGDNFGDDNNIGGNFGDINENNNIGIGENHIGGNLPVPMPKPLPIPGGFGNIHISKIGQNKRNKPNKPQDKQDKNVDKNLDKLLDKLQDNLKEKFKENKLQEKYLDENDKSNLPMPNMPSLNYEQEKSKNDLKLNEITGNYGIQGNLIDFSKLFGSFLKKK